MPALTRTPGATVGERPLDEPHPSRLDVRSPWRDKILRAHREALDTGAPGYADPETGLFVFTARYLADRGTCCAGGCRHCPYVS